MHFGNIFRTNVWRHITIEPTYFLFYLATAMMDFLNVNLYLQKACRFDRSKEPDLSTRCDDEKRGEQFVAEEYAAAMTVTSLIALGVCVFLTSYSDSAGKKRKPFVIIPISGLLMQSAWAMLQSYFWYWPPLLGVVFNAILPDFCGGWITVMVFSVLLIYDKTSTENRHVALTATVCLRLLATLIGKGVVGHLLRAVGFFYSFATCCLLQTLALICAFVFIPSDEVNKVDSKKLSLRRMFSLKKLGESLKMVLFPEKCAKHKMAIRLLMLLSMLVYFQYVGEESVRYLYFRFRFHWDEKQFSTFSAYKVLTAIIGGMTCTLVMSKWLKLHDSVIGTFTSFMDTLAVIVYFFATKEWHLYMVPLLDVFHGVAMSTCFSLVSKFFTEQEFGRLHSVHTLFNLATAFSFTTYSFLFKSTMETLPNAIFLLSMLLNAIICIIYSITYFLSKDIM